MKRKRFPFKSMRVRMIFFYVAVSVVVLALGSVFSYRYALEIFKQINEKYLLQQLNQSDSSIAGLTKEINRLALLFADDDDVQQFLEDNYTGLSSYDQVQLNNSIIDRMNSFLSNYSYLNSIYLYTDSGYEIGTSATNTVVNKPGAGVSSPFASSALHRDAAASFPDVAMAGGIKESDYNPNAKAGNTWVISIARSIKPERKPARNATIVINITEQYFRTLYGGDTGNAGKYIIDSSGVILSSGIANEIKSKDSAAGMSLKGKTGSVMIQNGARFEQLVFFRISQADWYLIEVIPLDEFSRSATTLQRIMVLIFIVSVAITIALSLLWMTYVFRPMNLLLGKMDEMKAGKFGVTLETASHDEMGTIISRFNEMSLGIATLMARNDAIQEEKIGIEIEALQAQINPHFLYNTLNMIKWMASMQNATNIEESTVALGSLLKPAFKERDRMWPLSREVEYLQNYLKIVNWRYGNAIDCMFEIDGSEQRLIPKFILQPIIENAVSHGLYNLKKISVLIGASEEAGVLTLRIEDSGVGMDEESLKQLTESFIGHEQPEQENRYRSVGLYNVNRRIQLHFGKEYGLSIESTPDKGTKVWVRVPADAKYK